MKQTRSPAIRRPPAEGEPISVAAHQARFIARRFGLDPDRARVVASLAFAGRPA